MRGFSASHVQTVPNPSLIADVVATSATAEVALTSPPGCAQLPDRTVACHQYPTLPRCSQAGHAFLTLQSGKTSSVMTPRLHALLE